MKITISISEQKLLFSTDSRKYEYIISSSKFGEGSKKGSNKTPLGLFEVIEKYGDNVPLNGIFKSRIFTGEIAEIGERRDEDLITSRILRLNGLVKSNENTYDRYIYIHGTNDERNIGKKASHGCIRMMNNDIVELYELIKKGCEVEITMHP